MNCRLYFWTILFNSLLVLWFHDTNYLTSTVLFVASTKKMLCLAIVLFTWVVSIYGMQLTFFLNGKLTFIFLISVTQVQVYCFSKKKISSFCLLRTTLVIRLFLKGQCTDSSFMGLSSLSIVLICKLSLEFLLWKNLIDIWY